MSIELFQNPKSIETERIIKSNADDMNKGNFITISGFKGHQFGNEVFSTMLKFKDLKDFLEVFSDVQREISRRKVNSIKKYILTGLMNRDNLRFFPSLTATSRGSIFYDENARKIAIDTHNSKLSINDGQHRHEAINLAIKDLESKANKASSMSERDEYLAFKEQLEDMVVTITIFNNLTVVQERQLFYDLNNLAQKPSKSTTIKLAQTDKIAYIARNISEINKYLIRYGVEYEKTSIHKNNENTILLTTIYAMVKALYKKEMKNDVDYFTKRDMNEVIRYVDYCFTNIFEALPKDLHIKQKYVIDKSYVLRGIAAFYYESLNEGVNVDEIKLAISNVDWRNDIEAWREFGGYTTNSGIIQFAGASEGGSSAIKQACRSKLNVPNLFNL